MVKSTNKEACDQWVVSGFLLSTFLTDDPYDNKRKEIFAASEPYSLKYAVDQKHLRNKNMYLRLHSFYQTTTFI